MFAPYVYIELLLGSSRRELCFWEMGYWLLTYSGTITNNFRSLQARFALQVRFLCLLPIINWAPSRELQEGAQCLYNGFSAPYAFRSSQKKFQKSSINIVSAIVILLYMYPRLLYCPKNFNAHPGAKFEQYSNSWISIVPPSFAPLASLRACLAALCGCHEVVFEVFFCSIAGKFIFIFD